MSKPDTPKPTPPEPAAAPAEPDPAAAAGADAAAAREKKPAQKNETGGPAWPEPTRYGDWERAGRVSDF